jgi:hypothetical protein
LTIGGHAFLLIATCFCARMVKKLEWIEMARLAISLILIKPLSLKPESTYKQTSGAFGAISLDFRVNQASQPTSTVFSFCKWSYDWINARIHAFLRLRRTAEASTQ